MEPEARARGEEPSLALEGTSFPRSRFGLPDDPSARPAVDAAEALAVEAQGAVEAAQLHALDRRVVRGQAAQDLDAAAQLAPRVPRDEAGEQAQPELRPPPARAPVHQRPQRRLPLRDGAVEDVGPPAYARLAAGVR